MKNKTLINRAEHSQENFYTKISNKLINDEHLNVTEKGLMVMILSNSDNYIFNSTYLQTISGIGNDLYYKSIKNLIELGYINKFRIQGGFKWVINEEPFFTTPENTSCENTRSENTRSENTRSENRGLIINNEITNNKIINNEIINNEITREEPVLDQILDQNIIKEKEIYKEKEKVVDSIFFNLDETLKNEIPTENDRREENSLSKRKNEILKNIQTSFPEKFDKINYQLNNSNLFELKNLVNNQFNNFKPLFIEFIELNKKYKPQLETTERSY